MNPDEARFSLNDLDKAVREAVSLEREVIDGLIVSASLGNAVELSVASFSDWSNGVAEHIERLGFVDSYGYFYYIQEEMYGNGGGGGELRTVSPDNLHTCLPISGLILDEETRGQI